MVYCVVVGKLKVSYEMGWGEEDVGVGCSRNKMIRSDHDCK
jgi:hypothetical protein